MSVLNNTKTESLHGYAPIELFMGKMPDTPLNVVFKPETKSYYTVPPTSEKLKEQYQKLRARLAAMHKEVKTKATEMHNANAAPKDHLKMANFEIGDFVLWSRKDIPGTFQKLQFVWRGPFRVTDAISDYVFEIEHLLSLKRYIVHSTRLKFYHDSSLNVTEELRQHTAHQGFLYTVESFNTFRWNAHSKKWEFNISWQGFPDESTWEPFASLLQDVPEGLLIFLINNQDSNLKKRLLRKYKKEFVKLKTSRRGRYATLVETLLEGTFKKKKAV